MTAYRTAADVGADVLKATPGLMARIVEACVPVYRRGNLARLHLHFFPHELDDYTAAGTERIVLRLERSVAAMRQLGMAGDQHYDFNRHTGLVTALKAERNQLKLLLIPEVA